METERELQSVIGSRLQYQTLSEHALPFKKVKHKRKNLMFDSEGALWHIKAAECFVHNEQNLKFSSELMNLYYIRADVIFDAKCIAGA